MIEDKLPKGILHSHERITTEIFDDASTGSEVVANINVNAIKEHEADANLNARPFKLGISSGKTPISLYRSLVEKYRQGKISFSGVEVLGIDEYYPFEKNSHQSRNNTLHREFLDLVDVNPDNVHVRLAESSSESSVLFSALTAAL